MLVTISTDAEVLKRFSDKLSRETLNFFEYKSLSTEKLRQHFRSHIVKFSASSNDFCISVFIENDIKGFLICELDIFATEIFGFNIYKITHFSVIADNNTENSQIIKSILKELNNKAEKYNIKYITFSLNQNVSNSRQIFNYLMSCGFYYINTLLTFKMEKEEFKSLNHPETHNNEIIVRPAENTDLDAVYDIASKSYKLDRFHLDDNLDRDKCNLFQAASAENSLLRGYADIIFIAEYKGRVAGYYSGKKYHDVDLDVTIGNAIISAVDESTRGLGVFSSLNKYLLQWFHQHVDLAEMGTYVNNKPVHKVWTNNRLSIVRGSHQLAWFKK